MKTFKEFLNESSITVYHPNESGMTKLDHGQMSRGGRPFGIGIYFTPSLQQAKDENDEVISVTIDTSKFIPYSDLVKKHIPQKKVIGILDYLHTKDKEVFLIMAAEFVDRTVFQDLSSITDESKATLADVLAGVDIKKFQNGMSGYFGNRFIDAWNKNLPNIHGTHAARSTDSWYPGEHYVVINDKVKVKKV